MTISHKFVVEVDDVVVVVMLPGFTGVWQMIPEKVGWHLQETEPLGSPTQVPPLMKKYKIIKSIWIEIWIFY